MGAALRRPRADGVARSLDDNRAAPAPLGPIEDLFAALPAAPPRRPLPTRPAAQQTRAGDWRHHGHCTDSAVLDEAGVRLEWFTSDVREERAAAIPVCDGCPVIADCRQAATEATSWRSLAHGVWGGEDVTGLTASALRQRLRREARATETGAP